MFRRAYLIPKALFWIVRKNWRLPFSLPVCIFYRTKLRVFIFEGWRFASFLPCSLLHLFNYQVAYVFTLSFDTAKCNINVQYSSSLTYCMTRLFLLIDLYLETYEITSDWYIVGCAAWIWIFLIVEELHRLVSNHLTNF